MNWNNNDPAPVSQPADESGASAVATVQAIAILALFISAALLYVIGLALGVIQ